MDIFARYHASEQKEFLHLGMPQSSPFFRARHYPQDRCLPRASALFSFVLMKINYYVFHSIFFLRQAYIFDYSYYKEFIPCCQ
jgi:hypothetical protein